MALYVTVEEMLGDITEKAPNEHLETMKTIKIIIPGNNNIIYVYVILTSVHYLHLRIYDFFRFWLRCEICMILTINQN